MERIWIRLGFSLTEKPMSTYPPADQPMAYSLDLVGRVEARM
jgi:hypothetical protein